MVYRCDCGRRFSEQSAAEAHSRGHQNELNFLFFFWGLVYAALIVWALMHGSPPVG